MAFPPANHDQRHWTNELAGIRRERGYGGIPLAPFPISNLFKVHLGVLPYPWFPLSLLVGFPEERLPPGRWGPGS